MADKGFLVCADITGYTQYLSASELEHASGILGELLNLLLGETTTPLHLSRVEGDAVISYSQVADGADPQVLVDRLESTYVAFRRAMEQMVLNTACDCNACANIGTLDLKIVVHHGPFVVQHLGAQDELMGAEVNFLFRLMKNHVRQELGVPGYLALTDAALDAIGLPGYAARLVTHTEEDAERGTVAIHVKAMAPVWEERRAERTVDIGEPFSADSTVVALPIGEVWAAVTRPDMRVIVFGADKMEADFGDDGRIGRESVYVCFHGDAKILHLILDWEPPTRYVFRSTLPMGVDVLGEITLEPVDDATTKLTFRASHPIGPKRTVRKTKSAAKALLDGFGATVFTNLAALAESRPATG